ncbi:MAG: alpha/beta hydrolase fold domain-containing protein [Bryobacter sp.]|jgi:acetyl esterase/lipase|nr:alpha/beta hydrolase fold domain-containing protein [Bryobacter sp. CoA8 C33]
MNRRAFLVSPMAASAQSILERKPPAPGERIAYGQDPLQFAHLRVPPGKGPWPVVINIHGGFWRAAYDLEHNGHLCEALGAKGIATFSLEYRRIGNPGGGWPGTLDDVRAAALHLRRIAPAKRLDTRHCITLGHSAGGQLALFLAAELRWIRAAISLAGVADLRRALELKLSKEVMRDFLGATPAEHPERYRLASPIERLPLGRPAVLIHGEADDIVPLEIARRYAEAARAQGDRVMLDVLPGGHFELIDPQSAQWATVERRVLEMLRI